MFTPWGDVPGCPNGVQFTGWKSRDVGSRGWFGCSPELWQRNWLSQFAWHRAAFLEYQTGSTQTREHQTGQAELVTASRMRKPELAEQALGGGHRMSSVCARLWAAPTISCIFPAKDPPDLLSLGSHLAREPQWHPSA